MRKKKKQYINVLLLYVSHHTRYEGQKKKFQKKKKKAIRTLNCALVSGNANALPPRRTSSLTPDPGSPLSIPATASRSAPNACHVVEPRNKGGYKYSFENTKKKMTGK